MIEAMDAATPLALACDYFRTDICHSCGWLSSSYPEQIATKNHRAYELLQPFAAEIGIEWHEPYESLPESFRNKVKLVVTGSTKHPNFGILTNPRTGAGADLRSCPLPTLGIREAIRPLADFTAHIGLPPYNMHTDRGVLKYLIIMESPLGELMVRFVVRRRGVQGAIFKHIDELYEALPMLRVCSINVQPEHKAIIAGAEEILVSDDAVLPMQLELGGNVGTYGQMLTLGLTPGAFFQTNTGAAQTLYLRAQEWLGAAADVEADETAAGAVEVTAKVAEAVAADETSAVAKRKNCLDRRTAWDLYCGVGGFGLALASQGGWSVTGVETEESAVTAARWATRENKLNDAAQFVVADALTWAKERTAAGDALPDAVIVNPPRRGVGTDMATWLEQSGVPCVLYSSCNVESLAHDLAAMPSYRIARAQVVDMFPHTSHFEVIALLVRK